MIAALIMAAASIASALPVRGRDSVTVQPDTGYVIYHDSPVSLPFGVGFRLPLYSRVDGLGLPWGPRLQLGDETERSLTADALVTYRSHLGAFDPELDVDFVPAPRQILSAFAGRSTFTNDDWIRSGFANSLATLWAGSDARNHFRADRIEARYKPSLHVGVIAIEPYVGGRTENAWSTGGRPPLRVPFSVLGRHDPLRMSRPNPAIFKGRTSSALAGIGASIDSGDVTAKLGVSLERAFKSPTGLICRPVAPRRATCGGTTSDNFTQATIGGTAGFNTFGEQRLSVRGHALITAGGIAPPQRWAYLGGAGTLSTVDLLQIGGDRLVFVQGDYLIPINRIKVKLLGSPYAVVRYAAGNAGVGRFPSLIQNVGVGAGISFLRADYTIDPARDRSPFSRRSDFSIGASLSR